MNKGRSLALWGAWLQLGSVFGLLGTVIGMIRAFSVIESEGPGDPELLAEHISLALTTTAIGMIPALIGLVLLLIALFSSKYRAPWFFWFMAIFSVLNLLAFPIGTVLGIIVLVHIIPRKEEFWCDQDGVRQ
ncbi:MULTISPECIES: MotA/TolQ/ExbB proton channel family protein [unclassified Lentimonas]|uniref:MotA/TolQ/ExbB proton channel family protein n=1 Tax=unclassified Lentimonas TaxID=2630993 RepID=UPI001322AAE1|nr:MULTISPECIES: MotA/TolQ/ExbB proton channel family protein [unclassified Lentimonas]CAA6691659.1 MotA/TolQ/ExbB proton channel family protein [Lentimonas sp. CC19]CAA6692262.1 MotA/TolQ/ExbB proton channel family protein [Lentimonas sp. CC10]CAA7070203.1 MotA/TolQ/ExbB proton channel family protein [Lentimonas sp. CC11]